jgi:hypothetical protein
MIKRALSVAACLVLVAGVASAQTFTATLSGDQVVPTAGPTGAQGFATITIDGTSIEYNILLSGVTSPTSAQIYEGDAGSSGTSAVDLSATFVAGTAFGTVDNVSSTTISEILADPAGFYVQVDSSVRGQLATGVAANTVLYFPVAAAKTGLVDSFFRSDLRVVNRTSEAASLTIDYFAENSVSGVATSSYSTTVAANAQLVLDDYIADQFSVTDGKGAVRLTSDQPVTAVQRTYTDERGTTDGGTYGNYVEGLMMADAHSKGVLPMLSNRDAGTVDYRSNIGWFNPGTSGVQVIFRAWATDGTLLGENGRGVQPKLMQQMSAHSLFSALANYGDFYVTYEADGPLFVYATPVDNKTNDALQIPASPLD